MKTPALALRVFSGTGVADSKHFESRDDYCGAIQMMAVTSSISSIFVAIQVVDEY